MFLKFCFVDLLKVSMKLLKCWDPTRNLFFSKYTKIPKFHHQTLHLLLQTLINFSLHQIGTKTKISSFKSQNISFFEHPFFIWFLEEKLQNKRGGGHKVGLPSAEFNKIDPIKLTTETEYATTSIFHYNLPCSRYKPPTTSLSLIDNHRLFDHTPDRWRLLRSLRPSFAPNLAP